MSLPVTTVLAGFLAIVLIVLSSRVIGARQSAPDDDDGDLVARRMRGQANFCEYVPLTLVLFALVELQGFNTLLLAILAALFAFARVIHGYAFAFTDHWRFGRFYGTVITFTVVGLLGIITLIMGILNISG